MKKVSIIISVLNGVAHIEDCLRSIIRLDYPAIEIIIIDGGSTDGTLEIIDKYKSYVGYFISEPDKGIYDAWNKAIKISKGDWLTFIGADDQWVNSDSLTNMMKIAVYPEINYVSGRALLSENKKKCIGKEFVHHSLVYGMKFIHIGSLHHKSLFRDYGDFDNNYKIAGDFDFFVRNGKYIKQAFYKGGVIQMGITGLSSVRYHKVFFESFNSLRKSSNFGLAKALIFILKSYLALMHKNLILTIINKCR